MEYAVPRERAAEAVRGARAILERHPVSFPIELRFVRRRRRAALARRTGATARYVAVHVFEGMAVRGAVPRGRGAACVGLGGRPHWGKRSFLGAAELAPRHPGWDAFQRVRRELDPGGRFANGWVRHVLG